MAPTAALHCRQLSRIPPARQPHLDPLRDWIASASEITDVTLTFLVFITVPARPGLPGYPFLPKPLVQQRPAVAQREYRDTATKYEIWDVAS